MKLLAAAIFALSLGAHPGMALAQGPAPATKALPPASEAPGTTQAPPPANPPELGAAVERLRQFITDDELALIYDFMGNSAVAALRGGEVEPLPPELEFKLEVLRERLYKEGNAMMQGFMLFLHQELDDTLKKFQLPSLPTPPNEILPPPVPPPAPERS